MRPTDLSDGAQRKYHNHLYISARAGLPNAAMELALALGGRLILLIETPRDCSTWQPDGVK